MIVDRLIAWLQWHGLRVLAPMYDGVMVLEVLGPANMEEIVRAWVEREAVNCPLGFRFIVTYDRGCKP